MNRIRRVSFFFRIVFQFIFLCIPIFCVLGWYYAPAESRFLNGIIHLNVIPQPYSHGLLHTLTQNEKILGFLVSLVPMLIQLLLLYWLIKLFKLFERGEIFSLPNIRYIRNIGYTLLLDQIINPFYQFLMGVILTANNPKGHRFAAVTLDQTNIGILLTALLVILISWIMMEGYKLREDQQLTI